MNEEILRKILKETHPAFWQTAEFWISSILGIIGVYYSVLAFKEAARAKEAAAAAGRSVKIQTVTIELTEILQRLDKLDAEITFPEARDLLSEVSRRLRRLIGPFSNQSAIKDHYTQLKDELKQSKEALDTVRPTTSDAALEAPNAVYYALQGHFASISEFVAEISGVLENQKINSDENV